MSSNSEFIRKHLEREYGLPFRVSGETWQRDPVYLISPECDEGDIFTIRIELRNQFRIVAEINPAEYSADSIRDMEKADAGKKLIFAEYASLIKEKGAKLRFSINESEQNTDTYEEWPRRWRNYSCRISKPAAVPEEGEFNLAEIIADWATLSAGMFLSLLNVELCDDAVDEQECLRFEGGAKEVTSRRYERNRVNRQLCLSENGYSCKICGFDFEKVYGELGSQFIHVHHIVPVSGMKEEYLLNPRTDLIPVCPNCHAMLHREDPPLTPEQLKTVMVKTAEKQ